MQSLQFHLLSFEGPDPYARAGGLASRVEGLSEALAGLGFETHLWFVGDPSLPGHERRERLHLHRWCQWVSRHHPGGVYDGEEGKVSELASSLPPFLVREHLAPHLAAGGRAVVLAEEWHTVDAVLHVDWLLRVANLRHQVSVLWNANNVFGFDRIPWRALGEAALVTTVSRYMKQRMREWGVEARVIPNGLAREAYETPDRSALQDLRGVLGRRTTLAKMARWDPDKRWLGTIDIVAEMKRLGWRPLLLARGGAEPHGEDVLAAARARGLVVLDRAAERPGPHGLTQALRDLDAADIVNLRSYVDPAGRRVLFRGVDAVLANSGHEPFGLVGLETMAVGGVACTGGSGEDYAFPGHNALVLDTGDPGEFMRLFGRLHMQPGMLRSLRHAARATARHYAWPEIVERVLLPRAEPSHGEEVAAPRRLLLPARAASAARPRGTASKVARATA